LCSLGYRLSAGVEAYPVNDRPPNSAHIEEFEGDGKEARQKSATVSPVAFSL
jgi:hypothetical protein